MEILPTRRGVEGLYWYRGDQNGIEESSEKPKDLHTGENRDPLVAAEQLFIGQKNMANTSASPR